MITDIAIARAYTNQLLSIRYTNSSRYLPQAYAAIGSAIMQETRTIRIYLHVLTSVSERAVLPYIFRIAMSEVFSEEKYVLIATSPMNESNIDRNMNISVTLILLETSFNVS